MNLTDEQLDRYARHIVLREIGGPGQVALLRAHVLVIGAGGIGCPALQALVGAGVGRLTVVDDDRIDLSNLQRQFLYGQQDVGCPKAEVAAAVLGRLNPDVQVAGRVERVTADTVAELIRDVDLVLDGSDNFATRLLVADAAWAARLPLVSAAVGRFQGQVGTWTGWQPNAPCYRCFVGDAFDAEDCDGCAELGVLGAMTQLVGSLGALEAVRALVPFGSAQAGLVQLVDGLVPRLRSMRVPKDPGCRTCGAG